MILIDIYWYFNIFICAFCIFKIRRMKNPTGRHNFQECFTYEMTILLTLGIILFMSICMMSSIIYGNRCLNEGILIIELISGILILLIVTFIPINKKNINIYTENDNFFVRKNEVKDEIIYRFYKSTGVKLLEDFDRYIGFQTVLKMKDGNDIYLMGERYNINQLAIEISSYRYETRDDILSKIDSVVEIIIDHFNKINENRIICN